MTNTDSYADPYAGLSAEGLPDDLRLGEPVTDATHAEFLQLLAAMEKADDAGFLAAFEEWIEHTHHHFEQEEQWMEAMQFGPRFCHTNEHQGVMSVAKAVRDKIVEERADPEGPGKGALSLGRRLTGELSGWFDNHVKSMDTMMVEHMKANGFSLVEAPAA
ncbi:cation-binding hemerythrin HHE family protein [Cupriavidus sp. HMR-1]|uniref:bacteriohemerythrin n=1 Tax=Cupriavidus sp. HMR-1 TaxID=1249621 RepID=UPI0002A407CC|nr:bacteriohemerythrin [Cupriavidus sp. HMR-1]EKZ98515.1 cation-binding hemerythrin HHE family protein [Cupriavidus sp. HMR-1]